MCDVFKKIFKTTSDLDKIRKSVDDHKAKVDSIITEINLGKSFKEKYSDVLFELCDYLKIYIWKKDKNHKYNFSNIHHCVDFLGLDIECVDKIQGLTDKEIFENQRCETNKSDFLCDVINLTDEIPKNEKKECNFIEGNFNKKILGVKKIPIIENNNFKGTIGLAQECYNRNLVSEILNKKIENNNAKLIYGAIDKDFCYRIYNAQKHNNLFSFIIK